MPNFKKDKSGSTRTETGDDGRRLRIREYDGFLSFIFSDTSGRVSPKDKGFYYQFTLSPDHLKHLADDVWPEVFETIIENGWTKLEDFKQAEVFGVLLDDEIEEDWPEQLN